MRREAWFIEPRDPLVVRDGRSTTDLGSGAPFPFPLPNTVAGMVRAFFVRGQADVTREEAEALLSIRIAAGPWLAREDERSGAFEPWLVAPADAVYGMFGAGTDKERAFARGQVIFPGQHEGVLWPEGTPEELGVIRLPAKDDEGQKTTHAAEVAPFWPLERALEWAIQPGNRLPAKELSRGTTTIAEEGRVHVRIDNDTATAEPGMLFGTPGLRFSEGFGIALEVEGPADARWPEAHDLVLMGGESRLSVRRTATGAAFPGFARFEATRARLFGAQEARAGEAERASMPVPAGLRLQLLTHAWLPPGSAGEPAWLPSWWQSGRHPRSPSGLRLRLVAACVPGYTSISGWNLQAMAPRAVRRLVPAGSVYYFRVMREAEAVAPASAEEIHEVARALWAAPLDPATPGAGAPDMNRFLAPAAWDGFGLVLPGFWWEDEGCSRRGGAGEG